ncbi:hypothetical protein ACFOGI_02970 [Virgibacillus xinjiangensis]|uniref:DUF4829 domain-containing protein n=1 Tax=Virgibacillus xinjiangensis TaxID=393090 RepID=A0ABV7CSI4_9BACI
MLKKFLTIAIIIVGLYLLMNFYMGGSLAEEQREQVYERSHQLIVDIFEEESDEVFEDYLSSELQTNHSTIAWQAHSDKISENDLENITAFGSLEEDSIYTTRSLFGDTTLKYAINMEVTMDTKNGTETGETLVEWVRQEDELRLHYMEFPFTFDSTEDDYKVTTFGE